MQQSLNQQQLETFAGAALEVQRISDDYQLRFASANSFQEQRAIQDEATSKMTKAVEDKGMTVDEYNEVARAAQADPDVATRISELVRQASDQS
jgi:hypothetical protein